MRPLLADVSCPCQFLAAIVVQGNAEDQDEDDPLSSVRGEPLFNVVGSLSAPTKEKVGNFLSESYTVRVAPCIRSVSLLFVFLKPLFTTATDIICNSIVFHAIEIYIRIHLWNLRLQVLFIT